MTRLLTALFGILVLALIIWSFSSIKESYKMFPVAGSDPRMAPAFSDWFDFKSPTFEAKFPTLPEQGEQTVKDPKTGTIRKYDTYFSVKANGTVFMISLIEFLDTNESMETLKKTLINDLLTSSPQNQLKNMEIGTYKLFKTIDFEISNPTTTIDGRTFSDGNLIYLLTVISNNGSIDHRENQFFINSFEWIAPK